MKMHSGQRRTKVLAALSLFILLFSVGAALGQPVVERLATAHEGVRDIHARFVQTTTLEASGLDRVSGGTVIFKRGSKMRWSMVCPVTSSPTPLTI